jgi:hypothetical protein
MINYENPSGSMFIEVNAPTFRDEVEKLFSSGPSIRTAATSAETAVLNDAYELIAISQKIRIDVFADNFLRSPKVYNEVLAIARSGYRERHPAEFSALSSEKPASFAVPPKNRALVPLWAKNQRNILFFFVVSGLAALIIFGLRKFDFKLHNHTYGESGVKSKVKNALLRKRITGGEKTYLTDIDSETGKKYIRAAYRADGYLMHAYTGKYQNIVDLILYHTSRQYFLQYRNWDNGRIEADVVRNLYSAMISGSVHYGIIISPAHFSLEARKFAREAAITIVSENNLLVMLQRGRQALAAEKTAAHTDEVQLSAKQTDMPVALDAEKTVAPSAEESEGEASASVRTITDIGEQPASANKEADFATVGQTILFATARSAPGPTPDALDSHIERSVAEAVEKAIATVVWQQITESLTDTVALAVDRQVATVVDRSVARALDQSIEAILEKKVAEAVEQAVPAAVQQAAADAIDKTVAVAVERPVRYAVAGAVAEAVEQAVPDVMATTVEAVAAAVAETIGDTVKQPVAVAVEKEIARTMEKAISCAVEQTVYRAVTTAVAEAVEEAVPGIVATRVDKAVAAAVTETVDDTVKQAVTDAIEKAIAGLVDATVWGIVKQAVAAAVEKELRYAVEWPVSSAVAKVVAYALDNTVPKAVKQPVTEAIDKAIAATVDQPVAAAVAAAVDKVIVPALERAIAVVTGKAASSVIALKDPAVVVPPVSNPLSIPTITNVAAGKDSATDLDVQMVAADGAFAASAVVHEKEAVTPVVGELPDTVTQQVEVEQDLAIGDAIRRLLTKAQGKKG